MLGGQGLRSGFGEPLVASPLPPFAPRLCLETQLLLWVCGTQPASFQLAVPSLGA